jgi:hypothetical protein
MTIVKSDRFASIGGIVLTVVFIAVVLIGDHERQTCMDARRAKFFYTEHGWYDRLGNAIKAGVGSPEWKKLYIAAYDWRARQDDGSSDKC